MCAPDYRTKKRSDASALVAVAGSCAALRWVQDHAAELGVEVNKIIVVGYSSGGHIALRTGITASPIGSDPKEAPRAKPAAVLLNSAVSDMSPGTGHRPVRFGDQAGALFPLHQLDALMPPTLVFHGDADPTVSFRQSVALRDRPVAEGNEREFVPVPGGGHNFLIERAEWRARAEQLVLGGSGKA